MEIQESNIRGSFSRDDWTIDMLVLIAEKGNLSLFEVALEISDLPILYVPRELCLFLTRLLNKGNPICSKSIIRRVLKFPIFQTIHWSMFEPIIDIMPTTILRDLIYRPEGAFTSCTTSRIKGRMYKHMLLIGTLLGGNLLTRTGLNRDIMCFILEYIDIEHAYMDSKRLMEFIDEIRESYNFFVISSSKPKMSKLTERKRRG